MIYSLSIQEYLQKQKQARSNSRPHEDIVPYVTTYRNRQAKGKLTNYAVRQRKPVKRIICMSYIDSERIETVI